MRRFFDGHPPAICRRDNLDESHKIEDGHRHCRYKCNEHGQLRFLAMAGVLLFRLFRSALGRRELTTAFWATTCVLLHMSFCFTN